ncbi:MAG: Hsp20/alpha crystallin family protein [Bacteroidota bacterium]
MTKEVEKTKANGTEQNIASAVRILHPTVDIQELADSYVVRLDIPGSDKESIVAQINASTLTVSAKFQERFKQEAAAVYRNSLPAEYRREFSLADDVDTQTVDAVYELGVLKITLKKKQQFLPKEITIA